MEKCGGTWWEAGDFEVVVEKAAEEIEPEKEDELAHVRVTMKTLRGRKVCLMVRIHTTVEEMVQMEEGMPQAYQRLIWQGRLLEDVEIVQSWFVVSRSSSVCAV